MFIPPQAVSGGKTTLTFSFSGLRRPAQGSRLSWPSNQGLGCRDEFFRVKGLRYEV